MKFFLIKALLPIIFTSITGTSMLLFTSCTKGEEINYDYSSWYNYNADDKSYNFDGKDWIGYISGSLTIKTDEEKKIAWVSSGSTYVAKDLVIPKKVADALGNEYKISNCAGFTFSSENVTGSVSIPTSFTTIGGYKSSFIKNYKFDFPNAEEIRVPQGTIIVDSNAISAKKIILSNSVTSLGDESFGDNLIEIYISNSVKTINGAFSGCTELTSINIPNSVTSINNAFLDCTGLTSVNIPNSVKTINGAFSGCTGLTSVNIPNSVTSIDNAFIECIGLTSISIPNSVTSINDTFLGCTGLTSISIPNSVTSINGAFSGCTALTSINIPSSVTSIGYSTFYKCNSLALITIPKFIDSINYYAFSIYSGMPSDSNDNQTIIFQHPHPVSLFRTDKYHYNYSSIDFKTSNDDWYLVNCHAKIVCSDGYYTPDSTVFTPN